MTTQVDDIAQALRANILSAQFTAGQRLAEIALSQSLGCSRTIIRLALAVLEGEGLVHREPNRGVRVRAFTLDQVTDAILVRGELEGMAARLAAERGLISNDTGAIGQLLVDMDKAIAIGLETPEQQSRWIDLNETFHEAIISASGNVALKETIRTLSRTPLVSSRCIVFDQSDPTHSQQAVARAHEDHHHVYDAICTGGGSRAQALMQEHARRSAANKRTSIDAMKRGTLGPRLPGIDLIAI